MNTHFLDQARQLSVEDQLELVTVLWDDIAKRNVVPPPMDAQKQGLTDGLQTTKRTLMMWFRGTRSRHRRSHVSDDDPPGYVSPCCSRRIH